MDTATELTMWHIHCIHSPLQTPESISDYIDDTNTFIKRIWNGPGEVAPTPPKLQVDAVENTVVAHRGDSVNAVRLRFKLPPKHQRDNDAFLRAIRHFCERIFKFKAEGELYCHISLMSPRSLIGIAPLSQWFRFYWTQGFLETFIHRRLPLFNELADAEFFWPWLGGVVYIVLASEQNSSDIFRGIKIALARNFDIEARRPPQDLENRSKELSKNFLRGVERVLIRLDATTKGCSECIDKGATVLPSDLEVQLFNVVLELFEAGFEVLTTNKEVFDEWQNIVSSTAGNLRTACFITGLSLGLFGWQAAIASGATATTAGATAATAGAATAVTAGTTAATASATAATAGAATTGGATMCSAAVLGPFALFAVSAFFLYLHNKNHNKAKRERDRIKKLSEDIQGHHDIARYLAQWFISGHKPAQADEGNEMQDMRAQIGKIGLMPTSSLRDYKAGISSEADVIRQQLQKMQEDPDLEDYFS
ncbi:hypothetical protein FMUND_6549 [Fusarium mundagurra]|uniref:Uncharacterized protein n=1 Tax=Fusarium mundagurra TaxID=1567541 RepID=A0A8H6DIC4_9HYPO|nr:hypothetical protein FMUND_6549 [Fusarium mundagurra]